MAYTDYSAQGNNHSETRLSAGGQTVELPDSSFVRDADITRDGADLVLNHNGQTVVIEGYYAADPQPNLVAPDGSALTPDLVDSFTKSSPEFASNQTASDESPVGAVQEVTGKATITHTDGTVENVTVGTPIFQGDIIETDAKGAVNIVFSDNTSFAVSQDARLAIDEYIYDPATQSGSTDFSVLKGMFVFTSGLIGRDDPDDVHIKTPAGSIGIRGTIIAGNVDTGEITVVEGAIVLHDHNGHEVTLASQFETARFGGNEGIQHMGQLSAHDVSTRFSSVSSVSPTLFSSINDVTNDSGESSGDNSTGEGETSGEEGAAPEGAAQPEGEPHTDAAPVAPAPLATIIATGFSNTSGLAPSATTFTAAGNLPPPPPPPPAGLAPPPGTSGFAADLGTQTASAGDILPPPPPATTYDPNTGTTTTAPVNLAPVNQRIAPVGFFESVESNLQWNYHFDKEFYDPEHPAAQNLVFKLSNQTITDLNNWTSDGAGAHPDILLTAMGTGLSSVTGDEGRGWTFNESNGQLTLYMNNAFDAIAVGPGNYAHLDIDIEAIDPLGASSGLKNYDFAAYDPLTSVGTSFSHTLDGKIVNQSSASSTGTIAGDNNRFYLGGGNDILTIDNTGSVNTGSYNYVNVGRGENQVTVESDALHNIVVGGDDNDKIILRTAQVEAYGMDGDDTFVIDFANAPNFLTELNTAGSATVIDGGHSNFRAGVALTGSGVPTLGMAGGRGDTLELQGTGTLDFSQIVPPNKITGIERVDMIGTTAVANTVILRYQDVLNMTGHENALIINMDGNDTLTLVGAEFNLSNMVKKLDNFVIDDAANGGTADPKTYDVYSDGNVTLLIHDQSAGSANVTFDGTSVAV